MTEGGTIVILIVELVQFTLRGIMKNVVKKLVRSEQGAALILVLVVLLVGGLIAGGLLQHMGAGLLSGEVYARRTAELYAADAGVEDAIWKIQHDKTPLCAAFRNWTYPSPSDPPFIVNGRSVEVTIEYLDGGIYRITSIAATADGGNTAAIVGTTTVDAYLSASYLDLSALLEHAIVTNGAVDIDVDLSGKTTINGTIWMPDDDPDNYKFGPNVEYDPEKILDSDDVQITWPTYEDLSVYYLGLLDDPIDPGASINILYTHDLSDSYRNGALTIDNTGDPATLTLNGTLYVAGDLEFPAAGSHNYTVNLNGNSIFVEGSIRAWSQIGFSGSGCVIAKNDINFQPGIASEDGKFVLFMSVTGGVQVNPQGDFTGCIAANGQVSLHPNGKIDWISPEGQGLDFPMGTGDDPNELPPVSGTKIDSWEVSQQ